MACDEIAQRLQDLRQQKRELEAVIGGIKGAGQALAQENLASLTAQVAAEQRRLDDCVANVGTPSRPFVGRVKELYCKEARAERFWDEPYLLIAAVDRLSAIQIGPVPVATVPTVHRVNVGPWDDVTPARTYSTGALSARNKPAFWDLDGQPRSIASPEDVLFLVGVLEHDGASPDAIRGAVHTALETSVPLNINRAYDAFAATLASTMAGTIDTVRGMGVAPGHATRGQSKATVRALHFAVIY